MTFKTQKTRFIFMSAILIAAVSGFLCTRPGEGNVARAESAPVSTLPAPTRIGSVACSVGELSGFAWSGTIGWINMKQDSSHGVKIDQTSGKLSGYAWSENIGWISFGLTDDNTFPTDPLSNFGAKFVKSQGKIYGWAGVLSTKNDPQQIAHPTGWIKMSDDTSPAYGVSINTNTGAMSGFAWSEDFGWIDFSQVYYCPIGGVIRQTLNSYNYVDNYNFVDYVNRDNFTTKPGGILVYLSGRGYDTFSDDATVIAGSKMIYGITVTNLNSSTIPVDLKFRIPPGFTYFPADNTGIAWLLNPSSVTERAAGTDDYLLWSGYPAPSGDSTITFYLTAPNA